jgi:hypothetical protein
MKNLFTHLVYCTGKLVKWWHLSVPISEAPSFQGEIDTQNSHTHNNQILVAF